MENTWLYFFSALMQTAASLLALFSVFVIFKIEKINNKIDSIRKLISKTFINIKNNENTPGAEKKKIKLFVKNMKLVQIKIHSKKLKTPFF